MTVRCSPLTEGEEPAWDAFVTAHPDGTFFHLSAWRTVIAQAFGHTAHYILAHQDGAITGVLPLVHMRSRLFGNTLVSLPFCVYGGPIAVDSATLAALTDYATELTRSLDVPVLEYRFLDAPPDLPGWISRGEELYVTFRKPIVADAEANLKAIPRKQRAVVRRAIQNQLTVAMDAGVDRLHAIYAESVRNLGTPVFSRRYFAILMEEFAGQIDIVTILDGPTPIASVMNFYFRNEVLPYYGGGRAVARDRYGNDFMYWEVMRRATAKGCTLFDFGRSKLGTGAMAFKKNWGFVPTPMQYRFRLAIGQSIPDNNPLNPKFALFIAAWKRLPIPLANLIGPHIVRGLG